MKICNKLGSVKASFLGFLAVLLALSFPLAAWSQAARGTISGTVYDPTGAVIPGATVTLQNVDTGVTRRFETNDVGRFSAPLLVPGQYEIRVAASGSATVVRRGVQLEVGGSVSLDLTLEPRPAAEVIEVTAERPLVEKTKTEFSDVVGEMEVENLPINGRRWEDFVLLTPGVNTDGPFGLVSYRGISGLYNNNMVDGGDNNQAFFSESRGRTRLQYVYSLDSIQEFRVQTSNFSAEYGRAAGGIVNAVTRSGGNTWHGDVFYVIRDDAFQARDARAKGLGQPKPAERRQQFGGSIGGPLIEDKLFFFGTYDQQLRTFPITVLPSDDDFLTSCDPGDALDAGVPGACEVAIFNPDPNVDSFIERMIGVKNREGNQNVFLLKMDWVVNETHQFSGVFNFLDWRSPNGIFTSPVTNTATQGQGFDNVKNEFLILTLTSNPTPTIVNEFKFQFGRDKEVQRANNGPPLTIIAGGINFGQFFFLDRPAFPNEKRFQWMDNFSMVRGRHTLKVGADINLVDDNIINLFQGGGWYLYIPLFGRSAATNFAIDFARALAGTTPRQNYLFFSQSVDPITGIGAGDFRTTDVNFYFQDEWQVTPNFFLLAGLRYELQTMPNIRQANPDVPLTGQLNTDTNNLAPRIGLAWAPDEKTVIRAGYGMYYGRTQNSTIFVHLFQNGVFQQPFFFIVFDGDSPDWPNTVFPPPETAPDEPVGPGAPPSQVQPPASATPGTPVVQALVEDWANPLVHQAQLSIEREIFPNWSVAASYLMSRATRLPVFTDLNLAPPTGTRTFGIADEAGNIVQRFSQPLITERLNPNAGVILGGQSVINSWYHGFVLELNKRFSHGFQLNANFTVSKATDDGQILGDDGTFAGTIVVPNPFDIRDNSGESVLDVRRRFVLSGLWQIPGPDTTDPWTRGLLDGWQVSTIVRARDGFPFSPIVRGSDSANCRAFGGVNGGFTCGAVDNFGGTEDVRLPTVGRNIFTQPGLANVDLSIGKEILLGETSRLQFTWEVFNLFNRVNVNAIETEAFDFVDGGDSFSTIPGSCPASLAGCVEPRDDFRAVRGTSTRLNRARDMQFGVKLFF